jgi:hypothetical protein
MLRSFEDLQRSDAEKLRLAVELDLLSRGVDHEVVLLEANDEGALRRTHRRYFERLSEMGGSGFAVLRVDWRYEKPPTYGADTSDSRPPIRTGIDQLTLHCNRCGTEWNASKARTSTPGTFLATIGHVIPTCPNCRQSLPIAISELERQEQASKAYP